MRVSVCVGHYAKTPYCIPGLETEVRCMEELCHCMRENAFLLDLSIMEDRLLDWIEEECGLRELAEALHPLVHRQGSLSMFVMTILRYVGWADEEALQETERSIRQGAGLSGIEKRKSQIDHLVEKKRYKAALKGYDELLEDCGEADGGTGPAQVFLAGIWHNKGVAYAGQMLYDRAAECFEKAFGLDGSESECIACLAARRMQLSEEDYVAYAGGRAEWYRHTLELERLYEEAVEAWEGQPDYLRLSSRRELRRGDRRRFYEDKDRLTSALKESYRMEEKRSRGM